MAVLTVALLSVIAHLALGQGWGHMNGFGRSGVGAMEDPGAGSGTGMHSGWGTGMQPGWGTGMHSGHGGVGAMENSGAGSGTGMHSGWGTGMLPRWGTGMHSGHGGVGAMENSGAGSVTGMYSGWGRGMLSRWGQGLGFQEFDTPTMTCTFEDTDISGSVTLRSSSVGSQGGWGWGRIDQGVSGEIQINTGSLTPNTYSIVFTERSHVEGGCTPDGLGPILKETTWGHPWGSWGSGQSSGVVRTIELSADSHFTVDLYSDLPLNRLESYAGRAFALCSDVTNDACVQPIVACCKLGFDNQPAVTPPAPAGSGPV